MRKNPWVTFAVLLFVFASLFMFLMGTSAISLFGHRSVRVTSRHSVLHLKLEGVILDGKKFLKPLLKYAENEKVRAVVVEINSPGGVVGPSQEINVELARIREKFKKPVVAVSTSLMASGAYYAAVAADKIMVQPGTLMGSIGVIMEFANLEKLYDWAKVKRYTITTGKYKDSGAEYRSMRDDERELFQNMINEVWGQFKKAVSEGRKLTPEVVEKYADGRVMTGEQGVKLGFADLIGTVQDAQDLAAEMAGLGKDYEVFEPPKEKPGFFDFLGPSDDEANSLSESIAKGVVDKVMSKTVQKLLHTELANQPLFLMPGYW